MLAQDKSGKVKSVQVFLDQVCCGTFQFRLGQFNLV